MVHEEDGCFATQMECKVRRMGRSEAAGRRAGRHLRICMAERTEGGRERTKDHVPTYNRPRKRVSGNATEACPSLSLDLARRPTTRRFREGRTDGFDAAPPLKSLAAAQGRQTALHCD